MSEPETAAVRALPDEYRALTASSADADMRRRPSPDAWCALESAGHVRDAAEIEHARVLRLLTEDRPQLDAYDERAMVDAAGYAAANRAQLDGDLSDACERLGALLDGLSADQWQRPGRHPVRGDVTVRTRHRALRRARARTLRADAARTGGRGDVRRPRRTRTVG